MEVIHDGKRELATVTIGAVTAVLDSGTSSVKVASQAGGASGKKEFSGDTPAANAWTPPLAFGFLSQAIRIENRGEVETLEYSFDGVTVHGSLLPEIGYAPDDRHETQIYLRSANPTAYYVEAY